MRTRLPALPVLLAALLAAPLHADTPQAAPAPAAPAAPATDSGWSSAPVPVAAPAPAPAAEPPPPSVVTAPAQAPAQAPAPASAPAAPLRAPVVRRGGKVVPPAAATVAPVAPAAPVMPAAPVAPLAPAAPVVAPAAPATPAAPVAPAAPAPAAPIVERMDQGPVPGAIARIVQVSKEHNVALDDGTFALALGTTFTVDALEGGTFRVWVSFEDQATGAPIRATRASFAKPDGQAHVVTQPVSCLAAGETFDAPLLVPYVIFPNPGAGQSTEVKARIDVTREAGSGREVVVASALTTFRVHGS